MDKGVYISEDLGNWPQQFKKLAKDDRFRVVFSDEEGDYLEFWYEEKDESVTMRAGWGYILIRPEVTNQVKLYIERDHYCPKGHGQ